VGSPVKEKEIQNKWRGRPKVGDWVEVVAANSPYRGRRGQVVEVEIACVTVEIVGRKRAESDFPQGRRVPYFDENVRPLDAIGLLAALGEMDESD